YFSISDSAVPATGEPLAAKPHEKIRRPVQFCGDANRLFIGDRAARDGYAKLPKLLPRWQPL
ncbi:hypothetical protein ACFL6C_11405, partial [Myxococcota bacterium]